MQLPYVHIELVEGILVKDVDVTTSVHEDLRHPLVLNDRSYHQRESASFQPSDLDDRFNHR